MIDAKNIQIDLTLVIPTKDRSNFLIRALDYYLTAEFKHKIIIADSSDTTHLIQNKNSIQKVNSKLNISHEIYDKNVEEIYKYFHSVSLVTTPYVVIGADDDFFVPNTLNLAVEFLKSNPDYSVVGGEPLIFNLGAPKIHGKIKFLGGYYQQSIEDNDPISRLINHLSNIPNTWYSVHRTNQLVEYLDYTRLHKFDYVFWELLPSCLSIIDGKSKKLDNLYIVRQYNTPQTYAPLGPRIEWISDISFESQYILFRERICQFLLLKHKIDITDAKKAVNKSFLLFIIPPLCSEYKQEMKKLQIRKKDPISTIYVSIKSQDILNTLQELKVRSGLDWLLNKYRIYKLCRRSSPFYHDLKPIIESIVCEKPDE